MLYSSRFMTNEPAIFIELKIVFGEIQPLLENKFSLFQIHRKKPYPLLNVMLEMLVLEVEMLILEIGNVGFKIGNAGFKNQKFWDGGRYITHICQYLSTFQAM